MHGGCRNAAEALSSIMCSMCSGRSSRGNGWSSVAGLPEFRCCMLQIIMVSLAREGANVVSTQDVQNSSVCMFVSKGSTAV